MHPNAQFRTENRALMEALVAEIGFGMIFATTPDGPRVAHTPLLWTGDGALQFHLARGNALARHLDGMTALAVVNGPEAYVSPRWYESTVEVPTWNYVTVEIEGRVRRMDDDGLQGMLEALSAHNETRIASGTPWTMDKVPPARLSQLKGAIVGFELEAQAWRPTFKLSQNKSADERERVALGLEQEGSRAIAQLMRDVVG
ncbi:FMN-binding negative transcriptional regulator [Novosphingobium sp. HK4-1]|uniref:FMN-binding negative transcriptional regulator n=2 Tax=Novosphingobium mangrovi (ex Huang et al. 2023) TaxID=2976432 RepID=A0ABT2I4G7_9SPHN|nr:FMN-binding negative transcriptional regulator [Novosphingobium mangrovi (ex Huang et al. 2023)]MCT2399695.1 FMN-binding negative transcriptional regulator [Novosphingobium mangrovi (ex Huang et al. 2023)]